VIYVRDKDRSKLKHPNIVNIRVDPWVRDRLAGIGRKGERYSDIIARLIDEHEKDKHK